MSEPLSVLIVGCGQIAGGYDAGRMDGEVFSHAGAFSRDKRFTISACVEPDTERRAEFMREWNVPAGFPDLAACRESGLSFDVASLCAPTPAHERLLYELLSIPARLVFSEKPLTGDAALSEAVVAAYETAGRPLAVNYFRRWMKEVQQLRRAVRIGEWGAPQAAVGYYCKGLWNCGSHLIDLLQFVLGPLEPMAVFHKRLDYLPEDPTLDAVLVTEAGMPVYLVGSDSREFFSFEMDLTLASGRIALESLGRLLRSRRAVTSPTFSGYRNLGSGDWRETDYGTAMLSAADDLAQCVLAGAPLISNGRTALETERVCGRLMELAGDAFP